MKKLNVSIIIIFLIYFVIDVAILSLFAFIKVIEPCFEVSTVFFPLHIITPIVIAIAFLVSNKNKKKNIFIKTLILFALLLLLFFVLLKLNVLIVKRITVINEWSTYCWNSIRVNDDFVRANNYLDG